MCSYKNQFFYYNLLHRYVKASSPRLNIIILTGYGILLPVVIYEAAIFSINRLSSMYVVEELLTPICQVRAN